MLQEQMAWWKERAADAQAREQAAINGYLMMEDKPVIVTQKAVTPEEARSAMEYQDRLMEDAQAIFQDQARNPKEKLIEL